MNITRIIYGIGAVIAITVGIAYCIFQTNMLNIYEKSEVEVLKTGIVTGITPKKYSGGYYVEIDGEPFFSGSKCVSGTDITIRLQDELSVYNFVDDTRIYWPNSLDWAKKEIQDKAASRAKQARAIFGIFFLLAGLIWSIKAIKPSWLR